MRYFGFFILLSMTALSPAGAMAEPNWITAPPPSAEAFQPATAAAEPAVAAAEEKKDDGTCKAKEGEKEGEGASKDGGADGGKGENANKCEKVEWPTLTGKDGKGPWNAENVKQQLMETDPEYAKTLTDADFANMAKEYNSNISAVGTPESWGLDSGNAAGATETATAPAAQAPSGPWTADSVKQQLMQNDPEYAKTLTDDGFANKAKEYNSNISAVGTPESWGVDSGNASTASMVSSPQTGTGPWDATNMRQAIIQKDPNFFNGMSDQQINSESQQAADMWNTDLAANVGGTAKPSDFGLSDSLNYNSQGVSAGLGSSSGFDFSPVSSDSAAFTGGSSTGGTVAQNLASVPSYTYKDYYLSNNANVPVFQEVPTGTSAAQPDTAATPALVLPAGAKPPVTTPAIQPVVPAVGTLAGLNPAGMMANPGGMTNMLGGLLSGLSQSGNLAANASTPVTTPDAQGCYYVASGQKMCGGRVSSDSSATSSNSAVTTANSKGCYFVASGSFVCPETDISKLSSDCFKSSAKWMCPSEFGSSYSSEDKASATFKAGYVDGQQGKLIDSTYVNDTTYLQAYYTGQQDRQTLGIQ